MKYIIAMLLTPLIVGCSIDETPQLPVKQTLQKREEAVQTLPECAPKIIYQDRIVIEEKPVIKPVIKEKIVYKDKIVYKNKIVYRDRPVKVAPKKVSKSNKPTIGRIEYVTVVSADIRGKAKIDTGAKTTSIDARNIERFERDGKEWVKFIFLGKTMERPLVKNILIKRHSNKPQKRAVVKLRLRLGDVSRNVLVTLADREKYIYPILIGRNFLKDTFVVDVSRTFVVKSSKESK